MQKVEFVEAGTGNRSSPWIEEEEITILYEILFINRKLQTWRWRKPSWL
jgi:hypothetical protein